MSNAMTCLPGISERADGSWIYTHHTDCRECGRHEETEITGEQWMVELAADALRRSCPPICSACAEKHREEEYRQRAADNLDTLAVAAGAPADFLTWDASLGNNELLRFFLDHLDRWLYVCDRVDTGKTRAALRAMKMAIRKRPTEQIRYWNASNLAAYYAGQVSLDCNRAYDFRSRLGRCGLLIIDDIAIRGKYSDSFADLLYGVCDEIYSGGGAVWMLSNRPMTDLAGCLPARVYDAIVSRFGRERNAGRYASWVRGVIDDGTDAPEGGAK